MEISVIIPTFNEELTIGKTLDALARLVNVDEIIIVDGGSTDKTTEIAENSKRAKKLKIVNFNEANRGKQLHEGTKHASHEIFWFLHADTRPVLGCARQIKALMRYDEILPAASRDWLDLRRFGDFRQTRNIRKNSRIQTSAAF
jgi:glycosyltransferase involved in cell wall biosynthesis